MKPPLPRLEVSREELQSLLEHARTAALSEPEYQQLKAALDTLVYLTQLVEDKNTTIARLRQILFGTSSEKMSQVAILHRKNALFYKTQNGAHVGDLFMSLIYTCQLCSTNPFQYLTELQQHGEELSRSPQQWMPWNYRETLARSGASVDSG